MRSSLAPKRGLRRTALELTSEFEGGTRYTLVWSDPKVEAFDQVELPNGDTEVRLVVRGKVQRIAPHFRGVAPVRKG